jgi:cytochrome c-type biogenesis protein
MMTADANGPVILPAEGKKTSEWRAAGKAIGVALLFVFLLLLIVAAISRLANRPELSADVLALAVPAFIGGMLSSLSPCSLPIVMGYFSIAFQEQRERIGVITLAFLGGVATTMTVLGASFTALGSLVIDYQTTMSLVGGILVIGFGVMSILGKGFGGLKMTNRPGSGTGGAYVYGLVFALGWTTCVGPILGSILTLLLAEGSSVGGALSLLAGSLLVLIYVTGLGLPIFILVNALTAAGPGSRVTRAMRGRGWMVNLFGREFYLHSTAVISGLLLIGLGLLLATGQMTEISQRLVSSPLTEFDLRIEHWIDERLR